MNSTLLQDRLPETMLAFRGYNVTNLGRSRELLEQPKYGPIVREVLVEASGIASDLVQRRIDLVQRVRANEETSLESYADAVALVLAMEVAQLRLLQEFHQVDFHRAKLTMGYSLGEIAAISASNLLSWQETLHVPLRLAEDCVALTHDVRLAVLFCRGCTFALDDALRLCLLVNQQGRGTVGISARLSPNSVLLMGQGDTLDRFRERMPTHLPKGANLRINANQFPPLHTPIVWQRNIPNRAAVMMQTLDFRSALPRPAVLSLVTGKCSYHDVTTRDLLGRWTDHPQLLWEGIYESLVQGIGLVIHVGPEPNIIPSTFKRLRDNVELETRRSLGMKTLTTIVPHDWLHRLLPERTALLRAPFVEHVILEDWLLEHAG